jgi:hypothetical protein
MTKLKIQKKFPKVDGLDRMSVKDRKKAIRQVVERQRKEADRCAARMDEEGVIARVIFLGSSAAERRDRYDGEYRADATLFSHAVRQEARGRDPEGSSGLRDEQELSGSGAREF